MAVAQIYCDGNIIDQARSFFAEVRSQYPQVFAQGVLEVSGSLARGYAMSLAQARALSLMKRRSGGILRWPH